MAKGKLASEVLDVTPEMAREWLTNNLKAQRLMSPSLVELYKMQMQNGEWLETGEAIIFSRDGNLLNGQHRLTASAEGRYTLTNQVIVRGVDQEAFRGMDTGRKRIAADVLAIAGHTNGQQRYARVLAAVAQYGHLYKLGVTPKAWGLSAKIKLKPGGRASIRKHQVAQAVTHQDVLAFVEGNPSTKSSTAIVLEIQGIRRLFFPSSILAWSHFQGRRYSADLADEMVRSLITGTNLRAHSPFWALRELLQEEAGLRRHTNKVDVMAGFVKAWNLARSKSKVDKPQQLFKRDWQSFPRFE